MTRFVLTVALSLTVLAASVVRGADIFVDNLVGTDLADGRVSKPTDDVSGPVRTLRRAMQLAGYGDQIIMTRPGTVYYDSLSLNGARHSGSPNYPFTIVGNGAILSGLRALPPEGWRLAGPDLWSLTFTRKGFYRLMRDGKPLPESQPENVVEPLTSLEAGQWTAWQGKVYFKSDGAPPSSQSFAYSADQTGLTLYQVENVRIVDLTLRDFRFDGVHAQNMCRGVTLENVRCVNNGRAGVAVSGSSKMTIQGGVYEGNGRAQVRISGVAEATLSDVQMDGQPTIVP